MQFLLILFFFILVNGVMKKEQYKVLMFNENIWTPMLQLICVAIYQVDYSIFMKVNETSL